MKWPDERQSEDGYPGRYRDAADAFVAEYVVSSWRAKAVASVHKVVRQSLLRANWVEGVPRPPSREQMQAQLEGAGHSELSQQISSDDPYQGTSLAGALLADAVGLEFCSRPSVARWRLVGQIIEQDPIARAVLVRLVQCRMQKVPRLLGEIKRIARELVRLYRKNPSELATESDKARVVEMYRRWCADPSLREIWLGLRASGYVMPFRSDWHIFDLLFEIDIQFAVELIEEYEAPYQPSVILEWGACNPRRHFAEWKALMDAALPAFEQDGGWNGRFLLPTLLYIAQAAMERASLAPNNIHDTGGKNDHFAKLSGEISEAINHRLDGCAAALRWGTWLFREVQYAERKSSPLAGPIFAILDALVRNENSTSWAALRPADVSQEDELCLEAVRLLAAKEHEQPVSGRELLFQLLPNEPDDFVEGDVSVRMQALPSLFTLDEGRPDAFGIRVLAGALFDANVVGTFAELWRRTVIPREIVEHSHAYHVEGEGLGDPAGRASETIRFVIALGISLIDYLEDNGQAAEIPDRRAVTLAMFSLLHDALREMLVIDPIGRKQMENFHNHLCVRRCLYEADQPQDERFAAPLSPLDLPTLGSMLAGRHETSESFVSCLQILVANGVERPRIESELRHVGIDLDKFVDRARRLNEIEKFRPLNMAGL